MDAKPCRCSQEEQEQVEQRLKVTKDLSSFTGIIEAKAKRRN